MKFLKIFTHLIIILFLTILTQVGGLIWLLAVYICKKLNKKKRVVFPILYLAFNLVIIPPIANLFGRERLPIFNKHLKPRNWVYPLLFRNYTTPELKNVLIDVSQSLSDQQIKTTYLDANFPFIKGFPLLPHLSHSDGKKVDLSLLYLDKDGQPTDKKPSVSGYGVFSNSNNNYTSSTCLENGYWQYDYPKYLTFGTINDLDFDENTTKQLITQLLSHSESDLIFIEPHLKDDMDLLHYKIRFQGCHAVRHDDHIHFQIK